jgi:putative hemolysin
MTNGATTQSCQIATETTMQIALNGHDNTRLLNVCNHTLGVLHQTCPLLTSHWMRESTNKLIRARAGSRGPLIKITRGWQQKASRYLGRAP